MKRRGRQDGFLIIVAVLVVVIIAFIAVTATYQFAGDSLASFSHQRSTQAFYIAQSGISQATHDIATNGNSCSGYNSGVVAFAPSGGNGTGQYQVTGTISTASSTLNGNITNSDTTIPLASTSGFSSPGAITIDSETMSYSGISGNSLTSVVRGVNNTTAAAHSSGTAVSQNQCFLTSTAGIPTIGSPNGERILKALLIGNSFGFNNGGTFVIPSASSSGAFNMQGNGLVTNPTVPLNGPGFPLSNIISAGTVGWTGNNTHTAVSGGTQASNRGTVLADVQQNTALFNSANYFSQFFTQSAAQMRTNAIGNGTFHAGGSSIDGVNGQVIWYDGNLGIAGNVTIGTAANPVLLIVNGNLDMTGNAFITGFVFVVGTSNVGGHSNIAGSLASAGDASVYGSGTVTLNPGVLSSVTSTGGGNVKVTYTNDAVTLQEKFQ